MLKRVLTGVVSVVLVISLLLTTACSTPKVALTVNDNEISMGEYLAYVYETFYSAYFTNGLYQYAMYGMDPWDMEFTYGEGDNAKSVKLEEYLRLSGKDLAIRQIAVSELLDKYGLEWDKDDKKELDDQMKDVKESDLINLGFNKKNYKKAVYAVELNEPALFYGLYGKDGEREIPEKDIKKYYEENYLSYMSIEIKLQDSNKKDLSKEEIEKIEKQLAGYLKTYEKTGDFDAVIEQYKKDEEAKKQTTTSSNATTTTTTAVTTTSSTTTTTEEATTTTTTTTTAASTDDKKEETTDDKKEEDTKEEEKKESENRIDTTVDAIGDKNKSDAIKKLKFGEAKVVKYDSGSGDSKVPMIALFLRLDPDKRVDKVDYFEENRKAIMQSLKYEELDKEIKEYIKEMDVEVNNRAISMADPKAFAEAIGY